MFNNLEVIRTTDVHLYKNLILSLQSDVHKLNACVHCLDMVFFLSNYLIIFFSNIIDMGYFFLVQFVLKRQLYGFFFCFENLSIIQFDRIDSKISKNLSKFNDRFVEWVLVVNIFKTLESTQFKSIFFDEMEMIMRVLK